MGEAKEKKKKLGVVTLVKVTTQERIAITQLLDSQTTKSYEDRRKRRRVREAFGIVPKVHVFTVERKLPDRRVITLLQLGRTTEANGVQHAKKLGDRAVEITADMVDYLIKMTGNYEAPDAQSETLLDLEEMLHAVKDGSYEPPPEGIYPGVDEDSDDDVWDDVIDNED